MSDSPNPWTVPESWTWVPIGEVAKVIGGGTPPTSDASNFDDGTVPWVTPADLSGYSEKYIGQGSRNITAAGLENSGARILPRGTVLFSSRAPIGYVAIASNPLATNQGFKSFVLPRDIDPEYVFYFLQRAKGLAIGLASGTTFQEISGRQAAKIPLTIAPTREQHRIVEAIESYLTRIDDAIATLERVQRNLKRYRASVLKAAVEGRLVPTEAELARAEGRSYEPASVLLERILVERRRRWEEAELAKLKAKGKSPKDDRWKARYMEPAGPPYTDLPELPEGWCWATVDQLERGDRRSAYGVLVPGPDVPSGVPFVRVGDINGGRIDVRQMKRIERKIADSFAKTYLEGGEVLLTLVGTIGRTAVVPPALAGSNVARAVGVIPASDLVDPHWIESWFRSPATRALMIGKAHEVARKTLNLEDVRAAHVALPPRSEQSRIIRALDDDESTSAATSVAIDTSLRRSARLRQSILKWAFEGRLVDQDPTDEPAAHLLERIRAERESTSDNPKRRPRRAKATSAK